MAKNANAGAEGEAAIRGPGHAGAQMAAGRWPPAETFTEDAVRPRDVALIDEEASQSCLIGKDIFLIPLQRYPRK